MDLTVALSMAIFLLPVFIFIALLLKIVTKSNVIFAQKRPGKNEKIFVLYKFKSMYDAFDSNGHLLPDKDRKSKIGTFLRQTSLDEIPQLWNVIKGDMSLIGPRPLLPEYLALYSKSQKRRHEIRPGITGWAQINGRNALSWQKKFELDVWYVDNITFGNDLKILALTIKKVLIQEKINVSESVTMEKFEGNYYK